MEMKVYILYEIKSTFLFLLMKKKKKYANTKILLEFHLYLIAYFMNLLFVLPKNTFIYFDHFKYITILFYIQSFAHIYLF